MQLGRVVAAQGRSLPREPLRRAVLEQFLERLERPRVIGEVSVARFHEVRRQAARGPRIPRHAPVAAARRDRTQGVGALATPVDLEAAGRGPRAARDVAHVRRVDRALADQVAHPAGVREGCRRRLGAGFERAPEGGIEVVVLLLLEGRGIGQQLEHAREAHEHSQQLVERVGDVDQGQGSHEPVATQEHVHDRVRARVRRAEHHELAAPLRQALPQRAVLGDHAARDEAAHRVSQEVDRRGRRLEDLRDRLGQLVCRRLDRQAPVVGEGRHLEGLAQPAPEPPVRAGDRFVGAHARRGLEVEVRQSAARDLEEVEPDALGRSTALDAQVTAHDAGQQEHVGRRRAGRHGLQAAAMLQLLGRLLAQRREVRPRQVGSGEARHDPSLGARVREVAEVVDVARLLEPHEATAAAPLPARHRRALDDEVVVLEVVEVRELFDARQQPAARDVARYRDQIGRDLVDARVQQLHERRVRHHGLETRQLLRVGAPLREGEGHRVEELDDRVGEDRDLRHERRQDREVAVEALARQQRAGGRARDTHETADARLAFA